MRILLLGEFSGFYTNLKKGLGLLGHDVLLYGDSDGWKKIKGADAPLLNTSQKNFSRIYNKIIGVVFDKRFFDNFDAVFIIDFIWFYPTSLPFFLRKCKKHNKSVFLTSCGEDYAVYNAYLNKRFDYYVFDGCNHIDYRDRLLWNLYGKISYFKHINKYLNGVIPTAYEYQIGYEKKIHNLQKAIPLPVDSKAIEYKENNFNDKIIIFHGLNREVEKGTKYIKKAMEIIKSRYADKVEIIIEGRLPYDEYVKVISKTNIIIDQCKGYGFGMNAIISMAQGKVVLGGNRAETMAVYGIESSECPIVPICPKVDVIVSQLEKIVLNPSLIKELGEKGRRYVEKYHDCVVVAKQYVDIIKKYI